MNTIKHKKLDDMKTADIVGNYQTISMTHYDGCTRKLHYTDLETIFLKGRKIISLTDVEGYITHANSTFVQMSGYSKEELIGSPHYILRHPDMPRVAFKGLWEQLAKTGRWQGTVKNLRKDGGYYWVFASVFSIRRHGQLIGYTSSRVPTTRKEIQTCTELYRKLLAEERTT